MLRIKLVLALVILLAMGKYLQASETKNYLQSRASELCGHDGEVTYEQCLSESPEAVASDPEFFVFMKRYCGTSSQFKKCFNYMFTSDEAQAAADAAPAEEAPYVAADTSPYYPKKAEVTLPKKNGEVSVSTPMQSYRYLTAPGASTVISAKRVVGGSSGMVQAVSYAQSRTVVGPKSDARSSGSSQITSAVTFVGRPQSK